MNLRRLMVSVTFLLVMILALRASIDTDTWWHLKSGEWIVENRAIPELDPFSYTRVGQAWGYPALAWFSESLIYLLFTYLGVWALNLFVALFVTVAFAFIYMTLSGGLFLRSFVLVLAVITSGVYWAVRPYMFSFLFTAITLWVLEDFRTRRKHRLWLLPVLMLVWVNSHPGFAVGFLLLAVYFAGEVIERVASEWPLHKASVWEIFVHLRPLIVTGLLMLLAGLVNASGLAGLRYPFDTLDIEFLSLINEWQSPDFNSQIMLPFMLMLFLVFGALGVSKERIAASHFILLVGLTYMSLTAARNIALFALAAPIIISAHLAEPLESLSKRLKLGPAQPAGERSTRLKAALNWVIVLLLAAEAVLRVVQVGAPDLTELKLSRQAPLGAIEYIQREKPPGRLFNSYNWGGYLIWALPEYPVFIDGRTDLYADGLLEDWLSVVQAEAGWQEHLERWDVQMVLIEPSRSLAQVLPFEGWELVFSDEQSVLFIRQDD